VIRWVLAKSVTFNHKGRKMEGIEPGRAYSYYCEPKSKMRIVSKVL
jgi:hypothetical protein